MAISITKGKNTLLLTLVTELDREDVYQLHSDLGKWLDETLPKFNGISEDKVKEAWSQPNRYDNQNAGPSGIQFHNKEHKEAYEQAQSKLKLAEEMKRCFVDVLDTEYIQKELSVYQLNPLTKEVEIKTKKLKDGKKGI